jgi:hypothetical protein
MLDESKRCRPPGSPTAAFGYGVLKYLGGPLEVDRGLGFDLGDHAAHAVACPLE